VSWHVLWAVNGASDEVATFTTLAAANAAVRAEYAAMTSGARGRVTHRTDGTISIVDPTGGDDGVAVWSEPAEPGESAS
jgi:hypothetical protein